MAKKTNDRCAMCTAVAAILGIVLAAWFAVYVVERFVQ